MKQTHHSTATSQTTEKHEHCMKADTKAWFSIHECAMQLLWGAPVEHYECVNPWVQKLCLISVSVFPFFFFFGRCLKCPVAENWGENIITEKFCTCNSQRGFLFSLSKTYYYFFTLWLRCSIFSLVLGKDKWSGRTKKKKKESCLRQSVHTLFNRQEISCLFFLLLVCLFFQVSWFVCCFGPFMFSFYLKAEKCLKNINVNH